MKKIAFILLLGCLTWIPELWGQGYSTGTEGLTSKDQFQAAQWLRLAQGFWETGDYPMLGQFCRLIVANYPGTYYAEKATELLEKSSNPKKNRSREKKRNNPGIYLYTK